MYFKLTLCAASLVCLAASSFADTMGKENRASKGHFLVEIGGYAAVQNKNQRIELQHNLAGHHYTVTSHNQGGGLVGLGYFLNAPKVKGFPMSVGVNAVFLGQSSVGGYILEGGDQRNASYHYRLQSTPVLFEAKTLVKTRSDKFKLALEAGIGPNFMNASHYSEIPLNQVSSPVDAFSESTTINFAATVGAGIRFHDAPGQLPLELGYRFFYLGQGAYAINNSQVLSAIKTGDYYAHALVFTVTI